MATNNISEYEALLAGLKLAQSLEVKNIFLYCDSQLIVKQVLEKYEARETHLQAYLQLVHSLFIGFFKYQIIVIARADNTMADALSKLATTDQRTLDGLIYLKTLQNQA